MMKVDHSYDTYHGPRRANHQEEKDDHYEDEDEMTRSNHRKSLAIDAASLGRLTRLREEIVEAVATEKSSDHQDDHWQVKRASQTAPEKTLWYQCIQEAITTGLLKTDLDKPTTRIDSRSIMAWKLDEQPTTRRNDKHHDQTGRPVPRKKTLGQRASDLLEAHVRNLHDEKVLDGWRTGPTGVFEQSSSWHQERLHFQQQDREERPKNIQGGRRLLQDGFNDSLSSIHSTGTSSTSSSMMLLLHSSPLPSPIVPRWRKRFCGMSKERLKECVALQAANQALDRSWRLEYQTHQELKVRNGCNCVYCSDNPSPYQTQEYQRLQQSSSHGDPSSSSTLWPSFVDLNDDPLPASLESGSLLLDVPSLETVYGHPVPRLEDPQCIKDTMDHIITEAAITAWDRVLRLQKKGQQHIVKNRCRCCYCRTASPAQTRQYDHWCQSRRRGSNGGETTTPGPTVDVAPPVEEIPTQTPSSTCLQKMHLDGELDEERMLLEGLGLNL